MLPVPGLSLHPGVLSDDEQAEVLSSIEGWLADGRKGAGGGFTGDLRGKTFAPVPPNFSHAMQSREMLQFGVYTHSNRVEAAAQVAPLPPILVRVLVPLLQKGLVVPAWWSSSAARAARASSLAVSAEAKSEAPPATAEANSGAESSCRASAPFHSEDACNTANNAVMADDGCNGDALFAAEAAQWCCTVNCYEPGQWVPPHVDSAKFTRPFATLSLLSEQRMTFQPKTRSAATDETADAEVAQEVATESTGGKAQDGSGGGGGASKGFSDEHLHKQREWRQHRLEEMKTATAAATLPKPKQGQGRGPGAPRSESGAGACGGGSGSGGSGHGGDAADGGSSSKSDDGGGDGDGDDNASVFSLPLPVGSLLVLNGDAADAFMHGVPPVTARRVSLTFRKLRPEVASEVALNRSAQMSKGEAKRRAKAAAKRDKKAVRVTQQQQQQQEEEEEEDRQKVDGGASGSGSSGGGLVGKSVPVPLSMLGLQNACLSTTSGGDADDASGGGGGGGASSSLLPHSPPSSSSSSSPPPSPSSSLSSSSSVLRMPLLEKEHVQNLYDAVAHQWHGTRYKAWPRVKAFLHALPCGSLVCDAGCGNGKNLPLCNAPRSRTRSSSGGGSSSGSGGGGGVSSSGGGSIHKVDKESDESKEDSGGGGGGGGGGTGESTGGGTGGSGRGFGIGCDFSRELVRISATEQNGSEALVADALALPYRSGAFDAVLSIAVLHHISTKARRVRLLCECARVLKVGGRALVYAWARDQRGGQSRHAFAASDVLVPFHFRVAPSPGNAQPPPPPPTRPPSLSHPCSSTSSTSFSSLPPASEEAAEKRARRSSPPQSLEGGEDTGGVVVVGGGGGGAGGGQGRLEARTTTTVASKAVAAATLVRDDAGQVVAEHGLFDPFKQSVVLQRYCHVYERGELTELVRLVNQSNQSSAGGGGGGGDGDGDWVRLDEEYNDTGNWCVVFTKIQDGR